MTRLALAAVLVVALAVAIYAGLLKMTAARNQADAEATIRGAQ